MTDPDLLEGVAAKTVATPRLKTHLLSGGNEGGTPIVFVHGNASSSRFFEETLAALPGDGRYRGLAPDLRGFGHSKAREEVLLSSLLATKAGEGNYPGGATTSENWPHIAPGSKGINNAMSPKYCNLAAFADIDPKPAVL